MKCDANDCDCDATCFETYEDDLEGVEDFEDIIFKWCDKCAAHLEPEEDELVPKLISKDEYLIRRVMVA